MVIGTSENGTSRIDICVVAGTGENGVSRMDTNLDVDSKEGF